MIYDLETVPENKTVYAFAYRYYNDTVRLLVMRPTEGIVKNRKFHPKDNNSNPDSIASSLFSYADTFAEAVNAYNDSVSDRLDTICDMLKESSNDMYLDF